MKKTQVFVMLTLLSFALSSCGIMFGGSRFSGTIIAKDHPTPKFMLTATGSGKEQHPSSIPGTGH